MRIVVRVTPEEHARLMRVANAKFSRGRDLSKWARRVLFYAADQFDLGHDPY